jgi:2-polyprenyl-6-methoxyphenol hydroxylase-like FAD-dependent oxidoreductase
MDILWLRVSRRSTDPQEVFGHLAAGHIFIMIDRGDYWQCAFVIPKGGFEAVRAEGLEALRSRIAASAPVLADRLQEIRDWDDVKLLTVAVDRLPQWHRPRLLCIGDAAHTMSPIGGVGINLAVQDAVAAANILAEPLRAGTLSSEHLAAVQRRREWPTRVTQQIQVVLQNRVIGPVLGSRTEPKLPSLLRLLLRSPLIQRIPARLIGLGVRPEHIRTPEMPAAVRT